MADMIEIPKLKQPKEERKKSGVAWIAKSRPGAFQGARAASGSAGTTGALARSSSMVLQGSFTFGSRAALLGLAAATLLASAALFLLGGVEMDSSGLTAPELGAISSSLKIRAAHDSGALAIASRSAKGVLEDASTRKDTSAGAVSAAPKAGSQPGGVMKEEGESETGEAVLPAEERKVFERVTPKNDAWTSGGSLNAGGAANGRFQVALPKFGSSFDRGRLAVFSATKDKPGVSAKRSQRMTNASRRLSLRGLKSSRALGALRGMETQNAAVASVQGESKAEAAATQWTGTVQAGGSAIEAPAATASAAGPSGSGTPAGGPITPLTEPETVLGDNVTPWQAQADDTVKTIDQIKDYFLEIAGFWLLGNLVAVIDRCVKVDKLGDKLNVLGRQTNALNGQGQGDLFLTLGKKTKEGAWMAALQSLAGAVMMYFIIDAIKPDREEIESALKPAATEGD